MDHKEDRAFIRQFSGVIVAFMVLTVVLIFVARGMQPERDGSDNPSQQALVEKRIAPVGAVRYGDEGAAALAEAQAAAAAAAAIVILRLRFVASDTRAAAPAAMLNVAKTRIPPDSPKTGSTMKPAAAGPITEPTELMANMFPTSVPVRSLSPRQISTAQGSDAPISVAGTIVRAMVFTSTAE